MSSFAPGWYDDQRGSIRWWDGAVWTEHVATPEAGDVVAATEPRTSKLWILWMVLGVIVVGVAVALSILIPTVTTALARAGDSGEAPGGTATDEPTEEPSEAPTEDVPTADLEQEAAAALELYAAAWAELDCEKFMQATTNQLRDAFQLTDCAAFETVAQSRADSMSPYTLTVESIEVESPSSIIVATADPVQMLTDESGNPIDPVILISLYNFHLALTAQGWAIDEAHDLSDGRAESEATREEREAAVEVANEWVQGLTVADCDAFAAATTPDYRSRNEWSDCAALQQYVQTRNLASELSVEVRDIHYHTRVDPHFGEIIVSTLETWLYHKDENGDVLDPPVPTTRVVELHLVATDGGWSIDNTADGETPR